jgi:hypothetical protein
VNQTYGNLYYQSATLANLPAQVIAIVTRLKLFFATEIFKEDTPTTALTKFIVADIISGASDAAIDSAVSNFQETNPVFPFCAYSYDFTEKLGTRDSHFQRSGKYYDSTFGTYASSKTVKNAIPFIFFFNNPNDYFTAQKIVQQIIAAPTKLYVPISINSVVYYFSIIVNISVEKGAYSGAFVEHMKVGNIFDLNINCSIEYNDIVLDNTAIYPVDDMILSLYQMDDENDIYNVLEGTANTPGTPAITTTIPTDNSTGITRNTNIVVNFTASMAPDSVIDNLELVPYFSYTAEWNDTGTQLTITPVANLAASTLHNIIIHKDAYGFYNDEKMEEDGSFSFTTGLT